METIGDAVERLDAALFVGRAREVAIFCTWLNASDDPPTILNVYGPGGIGKSTLIRAFLRLAQEHGRPSLLADAHHFPMSAQGLLRSLGATTLDTVVERLNLNKSLLILDTFDAMGELSQFLLEEFLPQLSTGVRVVISGRNPLGKQWYGSAEGGRSVCTLPLVSLSRVESQDYLSRRSINDPQLVEQILAVAKGHPLTLSVASDLVQQFGVRNLRSAPEWHASLGALIDLVLRDAADDSLRELLDVCAVVRRFDEEVVAAVASVSGAADAFERLTRLSFVRSGDHGYVLHDEIRSLLIEDLKNRRPDRYRALRSHILAYYRERMREVAEDREQLLMDRFYLWENAIFHSFFYTGTDRTFDKTYVEDGTTGEAKAIFPEILDCTLRVLDLHEGLTPDQSKLLASTKREILSLIDFSNGRIRILRNLDGVPLGLNIWAPITQRNVANLLASAFHGPLLRVSMPHYEELGRPDLGDAPEFYYSLFVGVRDHPDYDSANMFSTIMLDHFRHLSEGGVHFVSTVLQGEVAALQALGFTEASDLDAQWGGLPIFGAVLDLRRVGVEAWIEAIMAGQPVPRPLPTEDLEASLHEALLHWRDDERLKRSPLLSLPALASAGPADAKALRQLIQGRLRDSLAVSSAEEGSSLQAVELTYMTPGLSNQQVAKQLHVSRATYYRWLKRGIRKLAHAIDRSP